MSAGPDKRAAAAAAAAEVLEFIPIGMAGSAVRIIYRALKLADNKENGDKKQEVQITVWEMKPFLVVEIS